MKDLRGRIFGRLEVMSFSHKTEKHVVYWECKCSCGVKRVVKASSLTSGNTTSCGCYNRDKVKGNKYRLVDWEPIKATDENGPYYKIPLTRDKFSLIDTEDLHLIKPFKWRFNKLGYAIAHRRSKGSANVLMHRIIMGVDHLSKQVEVDHISHNKLDNRKLI